MTNKIYDTTDTTAVVARLREIDDELLRLWNEYCDRKCSLINEREWLQQMISNACFVGGKIAGLDSGKEEDTDDKLRV